MKATDFNLPAEIKFAFETGITTFRDTRLVLFNSDSVGLLRQNLIEELGWEKARAFFLRFGYINGYSDFMQMKIGHQFDSEMDLLAAGPVIHTWEGVVQATPREIRFDRTTGEFYFTGVWSNSYEAEQHLCFNDRAADPVCWSLTGYASGWCSGFFGTKLIAMEPKCVGKGDAHCEWKIQPPAAWGEEARPYIEALQEF